MRISRRSLLYVAACGLAVLSAQGVSAQGTFSSGSTGADGELRFSTPPSTRQDHAMAYDSRRQVTVMFGGDSSDRSTWEFDGVHWTRRTTASAPSGRSLHGMAYDEDRGVIVMFGGRDSTGDLDETWEYDGNDWTQRSPSTSPDPAVNLGMTYDTVRRRVLVVEGGETWEWDGSSWEMKDASSPGGPVAFDSVRGVAVLAQGSKSFEWDGTTWMEVGSLPIGPRQPSLSYDPVRGETLLFGGRGGLGGSSDFAFASLLAWDGEEWRTLAGGPGRRIGTAMVFDSARGVTVMFGGFHLLPGQYFGWNDTWTWDGSQWNRPPFAQPDPVVDMAEKPDGIWNYTTIDVPTGIEVSFEKNEANTPVVWLASGDVSIGGTINLDGAEGGGAVSPGNDSAGGPGGFDGGRGGVRLDAGGPVAGSPGDGPGGGLPGTTFGQAGGDAGYGTAGGGDLGGPVYGNIFVDPLNGGSGGGGGASAQSFDGTNGGGGGGAILIASSSTIHVGGTIHANGGRSPRGANPPGGAGSGGAIRLVANRIEGNGTLEARGLDDVRTGAGRIRTEAFFLRFSGTRRPDNIVAPPIALALDEAGDIRITSVAGQPVTQPPTGDLNMPDVVFSQPGDITVALATTNIPAGTVLTVRVTTTGQVLTAESTPTDASGNATAQLTVPQGLGTIQAYAEYAAPGSN